MGATWAGKNEWSLRLGHTPRLRGWLGGFRHHRVADRAVMRLPNRRRPVTLSPLADALAQLERIQIAASGGTASCHSAALNKSSERVRPATRAGASRARSVLSDGRRML